MSDFFNFELRNKENLNQIKNAAETSKTKNTDKNYLSELDNSDVDISIFGDSTNTQNFIENLSGKSIDELDEAEKAQYSFLFALTDVNGDNNITKEELNALDITGDKKITNEDINSLYEKFGSLDDIISAIDNILTDTVSETTKEPSIPAKSGAVYDEETGTYSVIVETYQDAKISDGEGGTRYVNGSHWGIVTNAYPEISEADKEKVYEYIYEMNDGKKALYTGDKINLPILEYDENGRVTGYHRSEKLENTQTDTNNEISKPQENTPSNENNVDNNTSTVISDTEAKEYANQLKDAVKDLTNGYYLDENGKPAFKSDNPEFAEVMNNENLTSADWVKIIEEFNSDGSSLINEIHENFNMRTQDKYEQKIADVLISQVEEGNEDAVKLLCQEFSNAINQQGTTPTAFIDEIFEKGSKEAIAKFANEYKTVNGTDIYDDIKKDAVHNGIKTKWFNKLNEALGLNKTLETEKPAQTQKPDTSQKPDADTSVTKTQQEEFDYMISNIENLLNEIGSSDDYLTRQELYNEFNTSVSSYFDSGNISNSQKKELFTKTLDLMQNLDKEIGASYDNYAYSFIQNFGDKLNDSERADAIIGTINSLNYPPSDYLFIDTVIAETMENLINDGNIDKALDIEKAFNNNSSSGLVYTMSGSNRASLTADLYAQAAKQGRLSEILSMEQYSNPTESIQKLTGGDAETTIVTDLFNDFKSTLPDSIENMTNSQKSDIENKYLKSDDDMKCLDKILNSNESAEIKAYLLKQLMNRSSFIDNFRKIGFFGSNVGKQESRFRDIIQLVADYTG